MDYKIATIYKIVTLPFAQLAVTLYPRVYEVTYLVDELEREEPDWCVPNPQNNLLIKPPCIPASFKSGLKEEVCVVDNAEYITVLVGCEVTADSRFCEEIFGENNYQVKVMLENYPFPQYVPAEGGFAETFTAFLE